MPRSKKSRSIEDNNDTAWGYHGKPPRGERTETEYAELVRVTKLRTLWDMSEREIRALERFYGCPVIRPARPAKRARRATGELATARSAY